MEKWCILRTKDNYIELNDWFNKKYGLSLSDCKGYLHSYVVSPNCVVPYLMQVYGNGERDEEATIITIEQFRELTKAPVDNKAFEPQIFN